MPGLVSLEYIKLLIYARQLKFPYLQFLRSYWTIWKHLLMLQTCWCTVMYVANICKIYS